MFQHNLRTKESPENSSVLVFFVLVYLFSVYTCVFMYFVLVYITHGPCCYIICSGVEKCQTTKLKLSFFSPTGEATVVVGGNISNRNIKVQNRLLHNLHPKL